MVETKQNSGKGSRCLLIATRNNSGETVSVYKSGKHFLAAAIEINKKNILIVIQIFKYYNTFIYFKVFYKLNN